MYSFSTFLVFTKIFMHNYILMWKITTTMKIIMIWIIQYLSLTFILYRFDIWKITKQSPWIMWSKKGTLIMNMALCNIKPNPNIVNHNSLGLASFFFSIPPFRQSIFLLPYLSWIATTHRIPTLLSPFVITNHNPITSTS